MVGFSAFFSSCVVVVVESLVVEEVVMRFISSSFFTAAVVVEDGVVSMVSPRNFICNTLICSRIDVTSSFLSPPFCAASNLDSSLDTFSKVKMASIFSASSRAFSACARRAFASAIAFSWGERVGTGGGGEGGAGAGDSTTSTTSSFRCCCSCFCTSSVIFLAVPIMTCAKKGKNPSLVSSSFFFSTTASSFSTVSTTSFSF
mmetsp:Transcript_18489/g.27575  ORF Transcript_18489/g.27575 Transcript_18489/m.27575 type:complete len:202 (+) Transcript_18489:2045-2650(+)